MRKLRIFLFVIFVTCNNAIQVKNSKNSRLYRGPKNPRRSGLSTYILRAHTTIPPRYFTGSPKPVWDEPVKPFKPIKSYTVECYPGQACSQTIPLWANQEYQPNTYEEYHDTTNSIIDRNDKINEIEIEDKVTFKPKIITTTTQEPSTTLGLSVASVYHPAVPSWQIPTTKLPKMPITAKAETIEEPVYNNYQRYDPFMFHSQISKRSFLKKPAVQKPVVQHLKPIISNYMDSRFSVPRVEVARREPVVSNLRNTITWKKNREPTVENRPQPINHHRNRYQEPYGYHHRNHYSVNRRVGYNDDDHEEYYPGQQRLSNSKPKRNYFPVPDHDGTVQNKPYRQPEFDDHHTEFVGEAQVVNAGYTVDESIDPHGYLMSSYEEQDLYKPPKKELDLSHYYDVKPTQTSKPWVWTTVEPWTSLDKAKPDWDEVNPEGNPEQGSAVATYGSWNKDTLKLSAVPFSRSTDGRERQWVKISSVKRKRKRIPGGTRHVVLDDNLGLNVNQ